MELNALFVVPLVFITIAIELVYCIRTGKGLLYSLGLFVFTLYLGCVAAITLFPLPLSIYPGQTISDMGYNLVPFITIVKSFRTAEVSSGYFLSLVLVYVGNVLLLMPLGFFLPLLFPKCRTFEKAAFIVLSATLCIEGLQLLIGLHAGYLYRCVDIDDVLLNFIGGFIGFTVARRIPAVRKDFVLGGGQ